MSHHPGLPKWGAGDRQRRIWTVINVIRIAGQEAPNSEAYAMLLPHGASAPTAEAIPLDTLLWQNLALALLDFGGQRPCPAAVGNPAVSKRSPASAYLTDVTRRQKI